MLSFSAIKTSEKNRIRDLEYELAQEKSKLEAERKQLEDLKNQLDKRTNEVKVFSENEINIRKSYE